MVDFIGSVQPDWPNAREKNYGRSYLTRKRKLELVRDFNEKYPAIPLCIDHANGNSKDFKVPAGLVVGYTTGMFLDSKHNDLCITGHVFKERPEAGMLIDEMLLRKVKWGLSAFTTFDFAKDDPLHIVDSSKMFTHIGITPNPDMAEEGSFIFEYSHNPDAIARIMREREIPNGAVANAHSLQMWGVHPTVARGVATVLDRNISDEEAALAHGTPTDRHPMSTASSPVPAPTPAAVASGSTPASPGAVPPPATPAPGAKSEDAMDVESPAAPSIVDSILAGMREANVEIEKLPSELDRVEAMNRVLNGVREALKDQKLALQDMPREMRHMYSNFENKVIAHDEAIVTELLKQGSPALNNNNNALISKFRSDTTPAEERRAIAAYVQANKSEKEALANNQKTYEENLRKEQEARAADKRSYEEQMARKRALDEEVLHLRAENDRLMKRRPEADALRGPSLGANPYNFMTPSAQQHQQQQQQQQQHQASVSTQQIGKANGYSFYQPPASSTFAQTQFAAQYSEMARPSVEMDRSSGFRHEEQREGFTSATGFRIARDEGKVTSLPANSWLSKYILKPETTSYGAGKADPVFASTYNFLSNELGRMGNSGMTFTVPHTDSQSGRETIQSTYTLRH